MHRKLTIALLGIALIASFALAGCAGQDGKVYLAVVRDSQYGVYCVLDSGLGLPDGWTVGTQNSATEYEVNEGAYSGLYNLAYYSGTHSEGWYQFNINSSTDQVFLNDTIYTQYDSSTAAYEAYNSVSYHVPLTFSLQKEKGEFLKNGQDRHYVLSLTWNGDAGVSYNGMSMAKTILADTADKLVMEFSGAPDKLTLTIDKKAAGAPSLANMSRSAVEMKTVSGGSVKIAP